MSKRKYILYGAGFFGIPVGTIQLLTRKFILNQEVHWVHIIIGYLISMAFGVLYAQGMYNFYKHKKKDCLS